MTTAASRQAELGSHEASNLAGEEMLQELKRLGSVSPALSRFILEDGFGDVLANATTGYREWSLLVLAQLTAMGDLSDQTLVYLNAARRHGATDAELLDVLNISYLYAGAPRAVTATRRMAASLVGHKDQQPSRSTESLVVLRDHNTMLLDSHGNGLRDQGVPIILIHALNMDHTFWRAVYPALGAECRTLAYDIRGHGHARGAPITTSLDQLADDLCSLLDHLQIPFADVYGASFGGAIAQQFAVRCPDRVRSLALISTFAKSPEDELAARAPDAEQHGMEANVAKSLIRWFLPETIAQDLWMVRYARNLVRRARPEEWAAAWLAMAQLDVLEQAGHLDMPVLCLSGKQDLSSTPELMEATAKAYKNSEFVSIDPGTHMMTIENPLPVMSALVRFRQRVDEKLRLRSS